MSNEAILFEHDDGRYAVGTGSPAFTHDNPAWHRVGPVDVSALTAPVATEQAQAMAAGWKLVPIEPTDAMLDAAARASMQHLLDCINDPAPAKQAEIGSEATVRKTHASRYKSMLAASPEAAPAAMERRVTPEEDAALRSAARTSSELVARGRLAATPAAPSAGVTDEQIITAARIASRYPVSDEQIATYLPVWRAFIAALSQPAPVQAGCRPITAFIAVDTGGNEPAYCLMAAYRSEVDASNALKTLSAPVQQDAPAPSMVGDAKDVCTDPDNCNRCKAGMRWRGATQHAGIQVGNSFGADRPKGGV